MKLLICFLLIAVCLPNALGGDEAPLGERIQKLIVIEPAYLKVTIDEQFARKAVVTKIEVWEGFAHWTARITTDQENNNLPKDKLKLVAELANKNKGGERYKALTKKRAKDYPEQHAELDNPVDGDTGKPLTLARLMQCVTDDQISEETGMCFIYVFRIMLFASRQCGCNECILGKDAKYQGHAKGPHLLEFKDILENTKKLDAMIDKVKENQKTKPVAEGVKTPDKLTKMILNDW